MSINRVVLVGNLTRDPDLRPLPGGGHVCHLRIACNRVRKDSEGENGASRFWIWMAADNLKLAALNAIACATELRRLRPSGKVQ